MPLQTAISSSRKDYSQVHCLKFGGGVSLLVVVRVGVWGMSGGETSFVKYLQSVGILVIQQASVEF